MLIDSSFCGLDSTTQTINIVNQPIAGISANKDTVCVGESVIFQNLSTGFVSNYIWDFGDSTILTETNPTHIYENNGYYNIILIAKNELCSDTSNRTISVTNNSKGNIIIHLLQTHIILTMEIFIKIMG